MKQKVKQEANFLYKITITLDKSSLFCYNDCWGSFLPKKQIEKKLPVSEIKKDKILEDLLDGKEVEIPERLTNDPNFMLLALGHSNGKAIKYASKELKSNRKFILNALSEGFLNYKDIPNEYFSDIELEQ